MDSKCMWQECVFVCVCVCVCVCVHVCGFIPNQPARLVVVSGESTTTGCQVIHWLPLIRASTPSLTDTLVLA